MIHIQVWIRNEKLYVFGKTMVKNLFWGNANFEMNTRELEKATRSNGKKGQGNKRKNHFL